MSTATGTDFDGSQGQTVPEPNDSALSDISRSAPVLQKPITQLGLKPHTVEEAIRDNVDSLLAWGLITPAKGEDNWQREGKDLGIKSKWRPHEYPALDPAMKK